MRLINNSGLCRRHSCVREGVWNVGKVNGINVWFASSASLLLYTIDRLRTQQRKRFASEHRHPKISFHLSHLRGWFLFLFFIGFIEEENKENKRLKVSD